LAEFFSRLLVGRLASRCLNPACWLAWAAMMINLMRCAPCFSGWANCILKTARKLCLPAMAAGGIVAVITGLSQPQISVWFLDVGQGDAILLQTSQGETLLVDGGETGSGYQVLMPAMDALGIHKIDLAVASHAHSDHVGGLIELIDAGRIDHILLPVGMIKQYNGEAESDPGRKLSKAIQISGIQMSELSEDDTIVLGSQIILDVLHAGPADTAVVEENLPDGNEWSLIMLAKLADHQLLLTSDCTQQTERQLLLKSTWPTAEFLKVAHHGSRLTTGEDFLNKVQPMAAIISVGLNVYGHPASETLSRLNQAGCQTYRTDQRGALQLILFPQKWELRAMLPKQGN